MKLVLFDDYRPGALTSKGVVDLSAQVGGAILALPGHLRMVSIIEHWSELGGKLEAAANSAEPLGTAPKLRAPLPRPSKMPFAVGNYNEGEIGITFPIDFFMKSPSSILDPDAAVRLPAHDAQLFFHEAELGVVIGRSASHVAQDKAMDHVFGYTCVNDVSSGGLPGVIGGIRSKCFDTFCPIGPCIVTKDEIADPHALTIRLWLDEVLRQDYSTSDMEHHIPELIEWLSAIMTLVPGDLVACGTNHHGIGPIQGGETIRMEIEGIGSFRNPVVDPLHRRWPVGPDEHLASWVTEFKRTGTMNGAPFKVQRIR